MNWEKRRLTNSHYQEILNDLIDKIPKGKYDAVYGIPRGGCIPATWISYQLDIHLMTEYGFYIPAEKVLIADDICDTGITFEPFIEAGYDTACLFWKPRATVKPTYYVHETELWVVFPYEKDEEPINRER